MRFVRFALKIAGILLTVQASAVTYSHVESVRVGSKTLVPGDSIQKIADQIAPDKKVDLVNNFGVKKGEEWLWQHGRSWTVIRVDNFGNITEVLDLIQ